MTRWGSAALYALFALSGLGSFALQITWARMFAAGLGHEMPAVLAVVMALFAGFAIGSSSSERVLGVTQRPGRCYAIAELAIGLWGALSALIIPRCNALVQALTGLQPSSAHQWIVAFGIPALALLPATAAAGATFPFAERFAASWPGGRRSVATLYAVSTFGAVFGAIVSVGLVLPALGLAGGLLAFSSLHVCCGLAAFGLERLARPQQERPIATRHPIWGLWPLPVIGLLGIGYQLVGVRVLSHTFENTIYTYSAVLGVYLLGTAVGAALYQSRPPAWRGEWLRQRLFRAAALAALAGMWILAAAPAIATLARSWLGYSLVSVWWVEFLTAGAVFALPTLVMGALFTHLVETAQEDGLGVGTPIGLNTAGCAFAPLLFGVLVLPACGAKWTLAMIVMTYFAIAWRSTAWAQRFLVLAVFLALTVVLDLRPTKAETGDKIVFARTGIAESVAVMEHFDGNRSLVVNNRFTMGGTGAAMAERRHATLPLLLHAQPHRALFLGLGTGITFAAASVQPGLEADGVELVQEIVEAMPWFEPFNAWPREKAFRVYVADARRFVRASTAKYDVIVADLFHPARDGAGFLYSLEHYQAIQARLAPAGLVCQWLPLYQLDAPMLRVIFGTFLEVFPDAAVFLLRFNVDTPVIGLVSGLPAGGFAPDYFAQRVTDPNLIEHLNAEQVRDGFHLLGCYVGGTDAIRRFCAGAPLNTDDHPRVVFGAPRSFVNSPRPGNLLLELLKTCSSDVRELVRGGSSFGSDYADALAAFVSARDAYLRGLVLESNGERGAALAAYLDSVRLSPRFNTGYAQCLSIAAQESKNNPQLARQMLESLIQLRPEWPVAEQLMKRLPLGQ